MIRPLVVFDLDGTLVDSQQDLADAANALIVELGGTPVPVEAIAKMVGDGAAMLVRRALTATGVRVTSPHDALERFLELYDDRLLATTRLYDGIPEVLDVLGPMARLGVLTNKPERATHRILEALGVAVRFEWMIGGDGPFARKPDPAGLLHLVADAGVSPNRAVMNDVVPSPTGTTRFTRRGSRWLFATGRLAPAATLADARGTVDSVMRDLERTYPETNRNRRGIVKSVADVRIHPLIDGALLPGAAAIMLCAPHRD